MELRRPKVLEEAPAKPQWPPRLEELNLFKFPPLPDWVQEWDRTDVTEYAKANWQANLKKHLDYYGRKDMGTLLRMVHGMNHGEHGYEHCASVYQDNYFQMLRGVGVPTKEIAIGVFELEKMRIVQEIKADWERDEEAELERQEQEQEEERRQRRMEKRARKEAYQNLVRVYGDELTEKVGIDPGTFEFKLKDGRYVGGRR